MCELGFSTGAIAKGDFRRALNMLKGVPQATAVELSALRQDELPVLLGTLDKLDLDCYRYISIHVPSRFKTARDEKKTVDLLQTHLAHRDWPLIVHPDALHRPDAWRVFGERLCLENMDRRKPTGKTVEELKPWFEQFPDARFCLDIGHAQQVDPSLTEAWRLLDAFDERMRQIHLSHVNLQSRHERISIPVLNAFKELFPELPRDAHVILESICSQPAEVRRELELANRVLQEAA